MIDPNNQNYFALEPSEPIKVPWWRVRKYQQRFLGAVGIAVGVGLIGYYAYQTYTLTHVDVAKIDQANTIIANSVTSCASESDPAACEARARSGAARTTGQASVCIGLADQKLVNCVRLIALDTGNKEVCAQLSGDAAVACIDDALLITAKRAKDYGTCAGITKEEMRTSCQAQLLSAVIAAGQCATFSIDQATCDYPAKMKEIIASGNPAGCNALPDAQKAGCNDTLGMTDQDKDGLSFTEESTLGTSDTDADTDGDGYTDGEEVDSGHDPLKK